MEGSAIIHSLCAGFGDKLPRPRVLLHNPAERSPPHDFSIYLFAALVAEYQEARSQLEIRLRQLTSRVAKMEQDLRTVPSPDSQDRATELENDEVLQRLDRDSLSEVRQIREALDRMESGSYGICSTCGQAIGGPRLAAVPSATTCRSCAS